MVLPLLAIALALSSTKRMHLLYEFAAAGAAPQSSENDTTKTDNVSVQEETHEPSEARKEANPV